MRGPISVGLGRVLDLRQLQTRWRVLMGGPQQARTADRWTINNSPCAKSMSSYIFVFAVLRKDFVCNYVLRQIMFLRLFVLL